MLPENSIQPFRPNATLSHLIARLAGPQFHLVSLENLEVSEGKGIIFPLQFMGNVIPSTGPVGGEFLKITPP